MKLRDKPQLGVNCYSLLGIDGWEAGKLGC